MARTTQGAILLTIWLLADVIWGAAIFAGCAYLVFWRGHSGLWFILAIILSSGLGGNKLYQRLFDFTGE